MRVKAIVLAIAIMLLACGSAFADSGSVEFNGDVALAVGTIQFSFTLPDTFASVVNISDYQTTVTVDVTQAGETFVSPNSLLTFYSFNSPFALSGGLFSLSYSDGTQGFGFRLLGQQSYCCFGPDYSFVTGTFDIDGGSVDQNLSGTPILVGGTVKVTDVSTTPEPESLLMLGIGLVALGVLRKVKQISAT
jgi:hypothetical protein